MNNNKRIAKNALFLYIRMLLSIVISLYTSRVVLQVLGEENYGIYGLVGSVVAMFTFLNTAMSGATARFLTHEMAKGNKEKLRDTFNSALIIHIGIALLILVLAETIGLWFLHNKLVIPEERMFAAEIVYQLSIASMIITITQVPYNATIIAHEKMDIYAYVELLNVTLKLVIVYILLIGNFDKLILYATLVLCVSALIAFIYRIYCVKHYDETHIRFVYRPEIIKPMLGFSLWDLYGNMSITIRQQGTNFVLNIFFGVIINAASGIATMVQGIISGFSGNILQAFRPQIIKAQAMGEYNEMQKMMENAIKFSVIMLMFISIPLIVEIEYVFKLWLVTIPPHTTSFCKVLLIMNVIGAINSIFNCSVHATGKIKALSFINGTLIMLNIPIMYLSFKYLTNEPATAYITQLSVSICILSFAIIIAKKKTPQLSVTKFIRLLLKLLICFILVYWVTINTAVSQDKFIKLLSSIFISSTSIFLYSWFILLDKDNRKEIMNTIYKRIWR